MPLCCSCARVYCGSFNGTCTRIEEKKGIAEQKWKPYENAYYI